MKACNFGTHRVIEPRGTLPQAALKIDNTMEINSNEVLIDVTTLNIDSASFTQVKEACGANPKKMEEMIKSIVSERGKMQNPVTGSGGMLIGEIKEIGPDFKGKDIKVGDKIATLVSLSLTPLVIDEILDIKMDTDQVDIKGQAILFNSGIYAVVPNDMEEKLVLSALDVAGAPAQVDKLVNEGNSVLVVGAAGKSGVLCCYQAMKRAGKNGRVIGAVRSQEEKDLLIELGVCHDVFITDATDALDVYNKTLKHNDNEQVDVSFNVVNVGNTEMGCILSTKETGVVYFFSMATSFTKAALGAEGVGSDVTMLIGNGYTRGHAELTLDLVRESKEIQNLMRKLYA